MASIILILIIINIIIMAVTSVCAGHTRAAALDAFSLFSRAS